MSCDVGEVTEMLENEQRKGYFLWKFRDKYTNFVWISQLINYFVRNTFFNLNRFSKNLFNLKILL